MYLIFLLWYSKLHGLSGSEKKTERLFKHNFGIIVVGWTSWGIWTQGYIISLRIFQLYPKQRPWSNSQTPGKCPMHCFTFDARLTQSAAGKRLNLKSVSGLLSVDLLWDVYMECQEHIHTTFRLGAPGRGIKWNIYHNDNQDDFVCIEHCSITWFRVSQSFLLKM